MQDRRQDQVYDYYDIANFANLSSMAVPADSREVKGEQLVWRTRPHRPTLQSIILPKWSVANLSILSRLQKEGWHTRLGTTQGPPWAISLRAPGLPSLCSGTTK